MTFDGLPAGKIKFDRIPSPFFNELLPQIDHLGELKVTLYIFWRLDRMAGDFRYLTAADIMEDSRFMDGLADSVLDQEPALAESLDRCVARGTLLKTSVHQNDQPVSLYFFNSPKGRAAVRAIQSGEWQPVNDPDAYIPDELPPKHPNIYKLYEENIGPLTPLLAEALGDAEGEFPAKWITEAFQIAVEKNIRNWRYVQAILRRWQERGYDVREERRVAQEDSPEDFRKYSQGDWADFIDRD